MLFDWLFLFSFFNKFVASRDFLLLCGFLKTFEMKERFLRKIPIFGIFTFRVLFIWKFFFLGFVYLKFSLLGVLLIYLNIPWKIVERVHVEAGGDTGSSEKMILIQH